MEDVWPGRGSDINNNGLDDGAEHLGGVNGFAVGVCRALERPRAQPAGASVTLGALDGLFLASEDRPQ